MLASDDRALRSEKNNENIPGLAMQYHPKVGHSWFTILQSIIYAQNV